MMRIAHRPVRNAVVVVLLSLCGASRVAAQAIDLSRRAVSARSHDPDSTLVIADAHYSVADVTHARVPVLTNQCRGARIGFALVGAATGAFFGYAVSKIPDGGTPSGTRKMTAGGAVVGLLLGLVQPCPHRPRGSAQDITAPPA